MNVVIVGAGRIGMATASLVRQYLKHKCIIIDADEKALEAARHPVLTVDPQVEFHLALSKDVLEAKIKAADPFVVVCSTPFHVNITVAGICARLNCHYIDFTEDVSVTKAVTEMHPNRSTFVLQTGLAPGLVTMVGMDLLDQLKEIGDVVPQILKMRVGALPLVGDLPSAYALTWSSHGLINEYYQPVERIVGWKVEHDEPLSDLEHLMVDGTQLEAFNTSGGLGAPKMYLDRNLMEADYKTLRYPGHLEFLEKKLVSPLAGLEGLDRIKEGVKIVEQLFPFTNQDVVYMMVRAQGVQAGTSRIHERSFLKKFYPRHGLTALELTTAGTGVMVISELMNATLQHGIVFGGEVPLDMHSKLWFDLFG